MNYGEVNVKYITHLCVYTICVDDMKSTHKINDETNYLNVCFSTFFKDV